MSICETVKRNILLDNNDEGRTQLSVYEDSFEMYDTYLFSASSDVPEYLYTPVWELMGLGASTDLANRVICNYGEGTQRSDFHILIEPTYLNQEYMKKESDQTGAVCGTFQVLVKCPRSTVTVTDVEQVGLRIAWLLDRWNRQDRYDRSAAGELPVLGNNNLLKNDIQNAPRGYFRCYFVGAGPLHASEWILGFRYETVMLFI